MGGLRGRPGCVQCAPHGRTPYHAQLHPYPHLADLRRHRGGRIDPRRRPQLRRHPLLQRRRDPPEPAVRRARPYRRHRRLGGLQDPDGGGAAGCGAVGRSGAGAQDRGRIGRLHQRVCRLPRQDLQVRRPDRGSADLRSDRAPLVQEGRGSRQAGGDAALHQRQHRQAGGHVRRAHPARRRPEGRGCQRCVDGRRDRQRQGHPPDAGQLRLPGQRRRQDRRPSR